jgi:hypothetical protein
VYPVLSSNVLWCGAQALIAYFFGKELKDSGTGLVAAALMAVVPGVWLRGSFWGGGVSTWVVRLFVYVIVWCARDVAWQRGGGAAPIAAAPMAVRPGVWGGGRQTAGTGSGNMWHAATGQHQHVQHAHSALQARSLQSCSCTAASLAPCISIVSLLPLHNVGHFWGVNESSGTVCKTDVCTPLTPLLCVDFVLCRIRVPQCCWQL